MSFRLAKIQKADIPEDIRRRFEQMGAEVVAQIIGRNLVIESSRYEWPSIDVSLTGQKYVEKKDQEYAILWLTEQRSRDERRKEITERVEFWILALVAVEAIPILIKAVIWTWKLICGDHNAVPFWN